VPIEAHLRRFAVLIGFVILAATTASSALAESAAASLAPASAGRPAAPEGLVVVALQGATDAAWPLARSVYGMASLRPPALDETHAHVLCGEGASADALPELRDLADTVAALHGDDAPSRALLGDIARRFSVRAIVVVRVDAGGPRARAFLADSASFDAAIYPPDEGSPAAWSATTRSLVRVFGSGVSPAQRPPVAVRAPDLATHSGPNAEGAPSSRQQFYQSGWFWGALGAAAFGAGAVFLATRDTGSSAIHLQLEVPH
jgi:hypothetical protein